MSRHETRRIPLARRGRTLTGCYTGLVETEVRERFERIEAILESIARRQDRADRRQDKFDRQL